MKLRKYWPFSTINSEEGSTTINSYLEAWFVESIPENSQRLQGNSTFIWDFCVNNNRQFYKSYIMLETNGDSFRMVSFQSWTIQMDVENFLCQMKHMFVQKSNKLEMRKQFLKPKVKCRTRLSLTIFMSKLFLEMEYRSKKMKWNHLLNHRWNNATIVATLLQRQARIQCLKSKTSLLECFKNTHNWHNWQKIVRLKTGNQRVKDNDWLSRNFVVLCVIKVDTSNCPKFFCFNVKVGKFSLF